MRKYFHLLLRIRGFRLSQIDNFDEEHVRLRSVRRAAIVGTAQKIE